MSWLSDFTTYQGRLRRSQLLWRHFVLCLIGASGGLLVTFGLAAVTPQGSAFTMGVTAIMVPFLYADMSLVVRRFHDVGLSGWWVLLAVLPGAISIALPPGYFPFEWAPLILLPLDLGFTFVLFGLPGQKGDNRYGPANLD